MATDLSYLPMTAADVLAKGFGTDRTLAPNDGALQWLDTSVAPPRDFDPAIIGVSLLEAGMSA
jgi:hypothetical protein